MSRLLRLVAVALPLTLLASCAEEEPDTRTQAPETSEASTPETTTSSHSPTGSGQPKVVDTVASGLAVPWGIDFLPDGSALVTERDSHRLLRIADGEVEQVGTLDESAPNGEGGSLGIAVSPTYEDDGWIFVYVTTAEDNRIIRYSYGEDGLSDEQVILDAIPNGFIHDGGRIEFGPDGLLYVATGEAGEPELAQDRDSLGGKILRITTDGDPASGNPDEDSPVWTLGHRNIQGLAFDEDDRLWASEFGASDWDELNLIEAGDNYGWPLVEGKGGNGDYTEPRAVWPTSDASPSGLAYLDGSLWMAGLRGERLWRIPVTSDGAGEPKSFFMGDYGRLRTVVVAPDGNLWVTTSNKDGRGDPADQDDRILVVDPG
ncbi:MAG: PQQ-dependent sugar dehydrogenase [Nocardioides sp.]|jgi:glucose/arabinose dehydrogenase